jgi:tetratricopeptide (TPR) repeat protein
MKCERLAVLGLALGLALACARQEPQDCGPSERVVDPVLLAFLSQARSAHHLADQREAAGDRARALQALRAVVDGPVPQPAAPEAREVLSDTRARIADLLSQNGDYDAAAEQIERGLRDVEARNYFRGHLFEVRGLLEERRAQALRAAGAQQQAEQARARSLEAYEQAIRIQAEVIQRALPAAAPSAR